MVWKGRLRRKRTALVAVASSLLALIGCTSASSHERGDATRSAPGDSPTSMSTSPTDTVSPDPVIVARPDWSGLATMPVMAPGAHVAALSESPIATAVAAMADPHDRTTIYVLGVDGSWRLVDDPVIQPAGDVVNGSPILTPTSFSPDGTRLALPQPNSLVVVDLTTGHGRAFAVGGTSNARTSWEGDSHVLVTPDGRDRKSMLVDLDTSAVHDSTHGPFTRVLPNGSAFTWAHGTDQASRAPSTLPFRWDDGRTVEAPVNNQAGWFSLVPLAHADVAVSLHRRWSSTLVAPVSNGDPSLDEELLVTNGVGVVNSNTGKLLGFLRLGENLGEETSLLGWRDELPVIGLVHTNTNAAPPDEPRPTYIVVWDYERGDLQPLGQLPSPWVAWTPST